MRKATSTTSLLACRALSEREDLMGKYSVWAVLAAVMLASTQARADKLEEKRACAAAADEGQQLRDEGKYRLAHDAFMRCARPTCPELINRDCSEWLVDLEQRAATIIVSAKDGKGSDLSEVKVTMDGKPLVDRLDGKPLPIDPGEHVFVYEASGFQAVEQRVVINASEKNRVLVVRFGVDTHASADSKPRHAAAELDLRPAPADTGSIPLPTWIFGGTAVAAFASAAYFGVSGISQRSDALGSGGCAPYCPSSEKDSIRTKFLVSDISLGIGVLSTGLAAYFFLRPRESKPGASATMSLAPQRGGGVATLSGRF